MPTTTPPAVLGAGLYVVHMGMVFCRKMALEGRSLAEIEQLMDALHEVPRMLSDWPDDGLSQIRAHLGCYNSSKWGGPDLVAIFENRLASTDHEPT